MRHFLANKMVLGLLLVVSAAYSASSASAAQIGDYRYRSWIDENNVILAGNATVEAAGNVAGPSELVARRAAG